MNKQKLLPTILALTFLVLTLNFISAIVVDADYITMYAGDQATIQLQIENNENFDIESVSVALNLEAVPFTAVSSSEKDVDDIDEDDDEKVSFSLRASSDIIPGDYNIPYSMKYTNSETDNSSIKTGSFGLRVSAKTEIDFAVEAKGETTDVGIVGQKGKLTFKIINEGLGEIKFVSVEVVPQGYELISGEKVYIGTIDSDDSDFVSFDVIFKSNFPTLVAKVEYKDFDNKDQSQTINLPVKVYTREQALELGLVQNPSYTIYFIVGGVLIIWFVWRKVKKSRKKNKIRNGGN